MMLCILCMADAKHLINIFDEHGIRLNISSIIGQHFWLEPSTSNADNQVICTSCWKALDSFHRFYERVKEAHNTCLNVELDPYEDVKGEIPTLTDDQDATHNDLLITGIGMDFFEDSKDDQSNVDIETKVNLQEVIEKTDEMVRDIKYDSESEIPLSKLAEYGESSKKNKVTENSEPISKKRRREEDVCNTDPKEPKTKKQMQAAWEGKAINDKIINQNMKLSCDICHVSLESFFDLQKHFQNVHNTRGYVACCDRKFERRNDLVDHILLHKNPEHYKCAQCGKILSTRNSLRDHKRVIHNKQSMYESDKCTTNFLRKQDLDCHIGTHVDRKIQCNQCEKFFASKSMLGCHMYAVHKDRQIDVHNRDAEKLKTKKHMQRSSAWEARDMNDEVIKQNMKLSCDICHASLENFSYLREHFKSVHSARGYVVCCDRKFERRYDLVDHILLHKNPEHLKCDQCEKVLSTRRSLREHKRVMHDNQFIFKCDKCNKNFHHKPNLVRHMGTCVVDCKVQCDQCGKFFASKSMLGYHIYAVHKGRQIDVHNKDTGKPQNKKQMQRASAWEARDINDEVIKQNMKLSCDICHVSLENFSYLREHFKSVHSARGYVVCCDRKFERRYDLVDHILLHKNPEHLKCDQCEKVLSTRRSLREHKRVMHDNQFIFKCDKCNKNFHHKPNLVRHMGTCVVDCKIQCDQCEKFYPSKITLGQHIYSVHKEKVCKQCGKIIHGHQAFRQHMLDHGNDQKSVVVKCGKCGIRLKHEVGLRRHMKYAHTRSNATRVCNLCGTVTISEYALKRHVANVHKKKSMSNV